MWTISKSICLLVLAVLSASDIKCRKVSGKILLAGAICTLIYQFLYRPLSLWSLGAGAAVGIFFLLVSKVTHEGFGYGDSLAILILGVYLGFWRLLGVLSGAFFLLAAVSVLTLCMKRMNRKSSLPFFPFLTVGYLISLLTGYI